MSQRFIPDARRRYLARRLYGLGPRPLYEYLCEILDGADRAARLERYAELDPAIVAALGGYALPAAASLVWGMR